MEFKKHVIPYEMSIPFEIFWSLLADNEVLETLVSYLGSVY